jgi:hypothetical protein
LLILFSFLLYGSCLKDYDIMAHIFADNDFESRIFFWKDEESCDSVDNCTHLETESTEAEDAKLVVGWQPHIDAEIENKVHVSY